MRKHYPGCERVAVLLVLAALCQVWVTPAYGQRTADCLAKIKGAGSVSSTERGFDLRFDRSRGGGSFSCDLGVRASEARTAVESFRAAVLYADERALRQALELPLTVRVRTDRADRTGTEVSIKTPSDWWEFQQRHLGPVEIAAIACASLSSVTIVKSRAYGFMIGDGFVWFQSGPDGHSVKVRAINLVPLGAAELLRSCLALGADDGALAESVR